MSAFELALFTSDLAVVAEAVPAGVATVVVDWEHEGKETRQALADTEVNNHTVEHLRAVRALTPAHACSAASMPSGRAPRHGDRAARFDAGADELLLPMVRTPEDVQGRSRSSRGRAGLGILVETRDAIAAADELARLPVSRVYFGLNDLAIERGTPTIFAPLGDGTLDDVRERFSDVSASDSAG